MQDQGFPVRSIYAGAYRPRCRLPLSPAAILSIWTRSRCFCLWPRQEDSELVGDGKSSDGYSPSFRLIQVDLLAPHLFSAVNESVSNIRFKIASMELHEL
jgi:hypothetical protein